MNLALPHTKQLRIILSALVVLRRSAETRDSRAETLGNPLSHRLPIPAKEARCSRDTAADHGAVDFDKGPDADERVSVGGVCGVCDLVDVEQANDAADSDEGAQHEHCQDAVAKRRTPC